MRYSTLARRLVLAAAVSTLGGLSESTLAAGGPLIIAHRGASGHRPEHTLEAYRMAMAMGADYLEPDLVMTTDGHLVVRHEPMLGATTDVGRHPEFAARRTTRQVDGVSVTDWFASDFTLAEIRRLRAVQPRAERDQQFNGRYGIPTFDEVIALAKGASRTVGIYPEIKHSTFHADIFGAHDIEDTLVATLHAHYDNSASAPVFIQSFEVANLQYLHTRTNIRLIQLIAGHDLRADGSVGLVAPLDRPFDFVVAGDPRTYADLLSAAGLEFVNDYAAGIGPWKPYLLITVDDGVDRDGDGRQSVADRRVAGGTGIIERAHGAGLLVHAWTFRDDAGSHGFADPVAEVAHYFALGVDGVFTDFPATGVAARRGLLSGTAPAEGSSSAEP
ncbi:MAG: glycerophosphodiester phosphodiesterase [Gammaproteobacteria bacterium]